MSGDILQVHVHYTTINEIRGLHGLPPWEDVGPADRIWVDDEGEMPVTAAEVQNLKNRRYGRPGGKRLGTRQRLVRESHARLRAKHKVTFPSDQAHTALVLEELE